MAIALLSLLSFNSCTQHNNTKIAIRPYTFNDSGLKVITYTINDKAGTMRILYGNEPALHYSRTRSKVHVVGEVYTLVTYKQQANAFWYGSTISGPLQQVETINMIPQGDKVGPDYATTNPQQKDGLLAMCDLLEGPPAYFP